MSAVAIIPARLHSTRLPRKLLLDDTGKPLIQYVWEAATRSKSLEEVIVATDSAEIAAAVQSFGGRAAMTGEHPSGTDRIAEVVRRCCLQAEIIVNLQGDEPELNPAHIDRLVATLQQHPEDEMATLATPMTCAEDVRNPNCVKVVRTLDGRALYFSRSMIPFSRDRAPESFFEASRGCQPQDATNQPRRLACDDALPADAGRSPAPWLLHVGIYAYRRDFLLKLTSLPPSPLEQLEKLEQLRALEAGATIRVAIVTSASVGIDSPEDYARFVKCQLSVASCPLSRTA